MNDCNTEPRFPLSAPEARPFTAQIADTSGVCTDPYTPKLIYRTYQLSCDARAGEGVTIAVVLAFSNPDIETDFRTFGARFGLPPGRLEIHTTEAASRYISDWSIEASANTEWAYAAAPAARILCVFTPDARVSSLFEGVKKAVELGADIVSMSWGSAEERNQREYTEFMKKSGRIFIASSGNTGGIVLFPSSSDAVISVGGADLYRGAGGDVIAYSAWSKGGGGPSLYTGIPEWQERFAGIPQKSGAFRATPDIALDACTCPGYAVYNGREGGFLSICGTSLTAPVFAGICARILRKTGKRLDGKAFAERLYQLAGGTEYDEPQYYFHDVTIGGNGRYDAEKGFDLCTGLGVPIGRMLIENF